MLILTSMKKGERQSPHRRIVELGPETLSECNSDSGELGTKRATTITKSIIISAPAEHCFELIAQQLEETPHWDTTIMRVSPISLKQVRVGFMSRVAFRLNGAKEEAVAMVRSFRPNSGILWTSNSSSQLQEEWQVQPEPHGMLVTVTLGYNPSGRLFGRLADKIVVKGKVEKAVSEMLERLKAAAENRQD